MKPETAEGRVGEKRRKTILIVEGDFLTRWDVAEYLRESAYTVVEAVDAQEAKSVLAAGTMVDAVLCNVNLTPNLEGHEFLQWIGLRYPKLPVLFTSMDRNAADLIDQTSTRKFAAKPYVLSNIEGHLSQLIGKK
jgi:DNA-binding NtrC family response regulator